MSVGAGGCLSAEAQPGDAPVGLDSRDGRAATTPPARGWRAGATAQLWTLTLRLLCSRWMSLALALKAALALTVAAGLFVRAEAPARLCAAASAQRAATAWMRDGCAPEAAPCASGAADPPPGSTEPRPAPDRAQALCIIGRDAVGRVAGWYFADGASSEARRQEAAFTLPGRRLVWFEGAIVAAATVPFGSGTVTAACPLAARPVLAGLLVPLATALGLCGQLLLARRRRAALRAATARA
jgi:hypothetical protein